MNLHSIVLAFALLVCTTSRPAEPVKLTAENYDKVLLGSNLQFVYKCLGRQTSISFHDGIEKTLKWETEDATVLIRLKHNRVVQKWQSGL
jgi:hypothetical protein